MNEVVKVSNEFIIVHSCNNLYFYLQTTNTVGAKKLYIESFRKIKAEVKSPRPPMQHFQKVPDKFYVKVEVKLQVFAP